MNPQKNNALLHLFRLSQCAPDRIACLAILMIATTPCFATKASPSATAYTMLVGGQIEAAARNAPAPSSIDAASEDRQTAMIGSSSPSPQASAATNNLKTALITIAGQGGGPGSLDGIGDTARFDRVMGLVADKAGNLYAADVNRHTIRKITPNGTVTTHAGRAGESGDVDGAALDARLSSPNSMTIDPISDDIYFISNDKIKKLTPNGTISTFFSGSLAYPQYYVGSVNRLAADGLGNVYVYGHENQITKIAPTGQSSVFVGNGEAGVTFSGIIGIAASTDGVVYAYDNDHTLYKITQSKEVTSMLVDDPVTGLLSSFGEVGISVDTMLNVYIGHSNGGYYRGGTGDMLDRAVPPRCVIMKIARDGQATVVFNEQKGVLQDTSLNTLYWADRLQCAALAVNATGDIYLPDVLRYRICKVGSGTGTLTPFVGLAAQSGTTDAIGTLARFNAPDSITITPMGDIFVADTGNQRIRKIASNGYVSRFAGDPMNTSAYFANSNLDGDGDSARFYRPRGITSSESGDLYIQSNQSIAKITPAHSVSQVANIMSSPDTLIINKAGEILYYESNFIDDRGGWITGWVHTRTDSEILKVNTQDFTIGYSRITLFEVQTRGDALDQYIKGITIDSNDDMYVSFGDSVCKVIGSSSLAPIAGVAGISGTADGTGMTARFSNPTGVAMDAAGCIYVIDGDGTVIRRINPITNAVTTIAGKYGFSGGRDGLDGDGYIAGPSKLFIDKDGDGSIYFADTPDNTIRMLQISPEILKSSGNQSAKPGANVILETLSTAAPYPTYKWYKNGNLIASATTSTLALDNVKLADSGTYAVEVSNLMGSATGTVAVLTVSDNTPDTQNPGSGTGGNSSSGGGGGALSFWHLAALAVFALMRLRQGK